MPESAFRPFRRPPRLTLKGPVCSEIVSAGANVRRGGENEAQGREEATELRILQYPSTRVKGPRQRPGEILATGPSRSTARSRRALGLGGGLSLMAEAAACSGGRPFEVPGWAAGSIRLVGHQPTFCRSTVAAQLGRRKTTAVELNRGGVSDGLASGRSGLWTSTNTLVSGGGFPSYILSDLSQACSALLESWLRRGFAAWIWKDAKKGPWRSRSAHYAERLRHGPYLRFLHF